MTRSWVTPEGLFVFWGLFVCFSRQFLCVALAGPELRDLSVSASQGLRRTVFNVCGLVSMEIHLATLPVLWKMTESREMESRSSRMKMAAREKQLASCPGGQQRPFYSLGFNPSPTSTNS